MKGLNITKQLRANSNSYFNMIDDSFIKVSTRAARLNEPYFVTYVEKFYTNKGPALIVAKAKELLRDKGKGVMYDPLFDNTLSIDALTKRVIASEKRAMEVLSVVKKDRDEAIGALAKSITISRQKATQEVDESIASVKTAAVEKNSTARTRIDAIYNNLLEYMAYWAVADAYTMEINKRATELLSVENAIKKGDVKELKALRSKVANKELKTMIDEAIKSIEEAQKAAEEKQKAIDEANKKLSGATTPEQKAAAQAELDALLRAGSDGAGAIAKGTGLPKGAIYIGIGLVVAVGAYFMFRKKD
jgi:hypothetical protein